MLDDFCAVCVSAETACFADVGFVLDGRLAVRELHALFSCYHGVAGRAGRLITCQHHDVLWVVEGEVGVHHHATHVYHAAARDEREGSVSFCVPGVEFFVLRGFFERAAINAPIQGSAADIIRRAMIRMPDALAKARLTKTRMLLQVHDELVFEVEENEVKTALKVVSNVMETSPEPVMKLSVPLKVDAKAAANWEAAH